MFMRFGAHPFARFCLQPPQSRIFPTATAHMQLPALLLLQALCCHC